MSIDTNLDLGDGIRCNIVDLFDIPSRALVYREHDLYEHMACVSFFV